MLLFYTKQTPYVTPNLLIVKGFYNIHDCTSPSCSSPRWVSELPSFMLVRNTSWYSECPHVCSMCTCSQEFMECWAKSAHQSFLCQNTEANDPQMPENGVSSHLEKNYGGSHRPLARDIEPSHLPDTQTLLGTFLMYMQWSVGVYEMILGVYEMIPWCKWDVSKYELPWMTLSPISSMKFAQLCMSSRSYGKIAKDGPHPSDGQIDTACRTWSHWTE